MAYLYVLWATEDGLIKIGITKNLERRLNAHTANSSNPLSFQKWKLYRLEDVEDARKLENITRKNLTKLGYAYRGKRELFQCAPTVATKMIDDSARELAIPVLKNFPRNFDELDKMGLDFLDLPYFLFDVPSPAERQAYFKGAEAVLHLLGSLDGLTLSAQEIRKIVPPSHQYDKHGREMWRNLLDSIAVIVGRGDRLQLINEAHKRIEGDQREAFARWQEIEFTDCDEAA